MPTISAPFFGHPGIGSIDPFEAENTADSPIRNLFYFIHTYPVVMITW